MKRQHNGRLTVIMVAVISALAGCSGTGYEVDYSYQILRRGGAGTNDVVAAGVAKKLVVGQGTRPRPAGVTGISTSVERVSHGTATIRIGYAPDDTSATVVLAPGETKEHFQRRGTYGIRVTVNEIRRHQP